MRPEIKQVVELIQRKDPKSLEEALALLQNTVFSFSMKVCGQRQDAEDTMQEVLFKSVPYLPKFDSPKALMVWLYKVAKNRCLMSRRRSKFAPKESLSLEELMPGRHELENLSGKHDGTPEASLLRRENARRLREAVRKLPPEYRLPQWNRHSLCQEAAMALFVVRHQHSADRCPAQDPYMRARLLNYLSRPAVSKQGVRIHGEAVIQSEHTFYLIVEAADEVGLRAFMQPFQMAGSVDIYPASTCARVVASGGCGSPIPVSELVPALDPEEACQQAIEAGLVVHRAHPLNCETSIPALVGGVVMPNTIFSFIRRLKVVLRVCAKNVRRISIVSYWCSGA